MLLALFDFSLDCFGSTPVDIFQYPHTCSVFPVSSSGQCPSLWVFRCQSHFSSKWKVLIVSILCFLWCQPIYHQNQYNSIFQSFLSSNEHDACTSPPCWRVLLKFGGKTAWHNLIGPDMKLSRSHHNKRDCLRHSMWYYQFMRRASALSTSIYEDRKHTKIKIWGAKFLTFAASL